MSYETRSNYPDFDPEAQQTDSYEIRSVPIEPQTSPLEDLGNLVISTVVGGALGTSTAVLPHTEAVVLEGLTETTQLAPRLEDALKNRK